MAVLESCPKYNMVAYLEKTDGNAEFHEIIDFLTWSSIHHPLIEHYCQSSWQLVSISKASIRSDLLFDDDDGIDSLPNQAIFDAIQLIGHLDAKKKFVMYPHFISIFLDKQLENVPVPLDHFPINALTSKDEGAPSERPSEAQPTPSPPHPSEATIDLQSDPSPRPSSSSIILDSIPESFGGNHGGQSSSDKSLSRNEGDMTLQSVYDLCISLCTQVSDQAKEIQHLKAQIKKLKKQAKLVITHHRAWIEGEPSVHKDPLFDEIPEDTLDYMETEDAQDVGRTKGVVSEEKENAEDILSTKDVLSTAQQKLKTLLPLLKWIVAFGRGRWSESESDGIPEAEKMFKQLASDEEHARKVTRQKNDGNACEAGRLLAEKLQEEEREQFTIEERAKFLHDTIAAQRKFLAQQRSEAIRNRPPTKNQLRNQMMTYLKHVGNFKHSDLKTKKFEEIQALYEKIKRSDEDFISIGSCWKMKD
ncbi:hypothetical protein Tco_0859775 [Tanacetum coccineum]|uniref:Uncharacterized protein n=1 Tax=Tanacetum coccineum TaxID=301880 RepID=A0ABQ5BFZ6_9ASTR